MPPITRIATTDDLPAILPMVHALAAHHDDTATLTLETLMRDTKGPAPWFTIILAEMDGTPVGYAALCPLGQLQFGLRGMDMHHLFVAQGCRGMGIARALVDASRDHARGRGCDYMMVGTHPDNHAAQELYTAMGFERRSDSGPRFRIRL